MHFGRAQDEHSGMADLSPPQPVRRNSQIARRARTRAWGRDAGQGARAPWEVSRQPTLACAFVASHQPARCAAASSRTVASGGGPQVDGGTHGGRGPVTFPVRNLDKDLIRRLCAVSPSMHANWRNSVSGPWPSYQPNQRSLGPQIYGAPMRGDRHLGHL